MLLARNALEIPSYYMIIQHFFTKIETTFNFEANLRLKKGKKAKMEGELFQRGNFNRTAE